jgi:hypothetical protein
MERNESLLRKIKALAERGIGGEKENAERLFRELCDKYDIDPEQFGEDKRTERKLKYKFRHKLVASQIIANVVGAKQCYQYRGDREMTYYFEATEEEYMQICAMFDFYCGRYEEELDLFTEAFIRKNHLFAKPKEIEGEETEDAPMTDEQKSRYFRVAQMMSGMDKHQFNKQIEQ